ncbi:MAG: hypothetical protein WKF57_21625, partial [Nakamurella sp.]
RLTLDIMLGAPWPMLLVWGPRRITAYNQAYADLAGPHHPAAPVRTPRALVPALPCVAGRNIPAPIRPPAKGRRPSVG